MSRSMPQQLLVNGASPSSEPILSPITPVSNERIASFKNRRTLKQLWDEADKGFFEETGYHIETAAPLHKDGVLQKWQSRYNGEKSSFQDKMDSLSPILQNIVNGIEIVGGFAASAASAVFGPAEMCFSAITFVLDAPGKIKHVYECLEALFKEVGNFLVNFRVLDRIDEKGRLDPELLENANKLLISFTHVCAVAVKLLKKKRHLLQALEIVFLTNDAGVQGALDEFKDLANNQAQTVGVISLEHILENKHLSQQILAEQTRVTAYLQAMSSKENDEKTRMVNKQKVTEIESKLFSKNELEQLEQTPQKSKLLPGTLDVLMASKEYTAWSAIEQSGVSELYLSGLIGTGKTSMIDALREHLNQRRQKMLKQGPSVYVAYHSFAERRAAVASSGGIVQALKNMALQVANQSTIYATLLADQLRDQKLVNEDETKKVWAALKLFDFKPPPGSVMYLLVDGLQGEEGLKSMQTLRRLWVDAKPIDLTGGNFKVCILLAGVPDVIRNYVYSGHRFVVIEVDKLNRPLIRNFIDHEFQSQEILEDPEHVIKEQRTTFAEALLNHSGGNFHAVKQKIRRMKEALDDDATGLELEAIIKEDIQQTFDQQAKQTLNNLADGLSPKHLDQFRKILMWMLYGMSADYSWNLPHLQAVLRLEQKDRTLESLSKKITRRFNKVLEMSYGAIWLDYGVGEYLRQFKDSNSQGLGEDSRLISMTINIKNAKRIEVQQFVLDLSAQLASDASIFSNTHTDPQECRIRIVEIDSVVKITLLCLMALNEGTPDDATYALTYAFRWLPRHLNELLKMKNKIPPDDLKLIQSGLAGFLSEPFYLEQGPALEPVGSWEDAWFGEAKDTKLFSSWLEECLEDLSSQRHLQARQRRWLKGAATRNNGRSDYLKETAIAIGSRWRAACLEANDDCIRACHEWLGGYLEALDHVDVPVDKEVQTSAASKGDDKPDDLPDEIQIPSTNREKNTESELDDGASLKNPEPAAKKSANDPLVQRLYRVGQWIKENLPGVQDDAAHSYCIAATLFIMNEHDRAIEWFHKAEADDQMGWRAVIGLATIKQVQKMPEESSALLQQAILSARQLHLDKKLIEHEFDLFVDTLRRMAEILIKDSKKTADAIQCLEEILEHAPKDGQSRWSLFAAMCKGNHFEAATELLDAWTTCPERCGDQTPYEALGEMATNNVGMFSFFDDTKERTLRDRLLGILQQAAESAKSRSQYLEYTRILYTLATAQTRFMSTNDDLKSIGYLKGIFEATQAQASIQDELRTVLDNSILFAARMKFDSMREDIRNEGAGFKLSAESRRSEIDRYVTTLGAMVGEDLDTNIYWYVASLSMILGRPEWCRNSLKSDVENGVQILSDEDPANDIWGAQNILRVFFCHNSDVNGRVAFSLLDRPLRTKMLTRITAADFASFNVLLLSSNANDSSTRLCNICDGPLHSITGFWICRWCPDVDFCQPCVKGFREGNKYHEHCSPDHEFVHLYHPECGMEELEVGKVMIDWQISYDESGDFSRKGGRLVDISEWLEGLRQEWDLSPPMTDTRAQA